MEQANLNVKNCRKAVISVSNQSNNDADVVVCKSGELKYMNEPGGQVIYIHLILTGREQTPGRTQLSGLVKLINELIPKGLDIVEPARYETPIDLALLKTKFNLHVRARYATPPNK